MNKHVAKAVMNECFLVIDSSPEGEKLNATRVALTNPIKEALGRDRCDDFENLVAQTIMLYGERMFAMGLEIGRNPGAAFEVPDSGIVR